jgi:hypothetical protein
MVYLRLTSSLQAVAARRSQLRIRQTRTAMVFLQQHTRWNASLSMAIFAYLQETIRLRDGRQSDRAHACASRRGHAEACCMTCVTPCLPELSLASGRRADLDHLCRKRARSGSSRSRRRSRTFRVDRKWPEYRLHFAIVCSLPRCKDVPLDIFPEECGLFLSDGYGARDDPRSAGAPSWRLRRANP